MSFEAAICLAVLVSCIVWAIAQEKRSREVSEAQRKLLLSEEVRRYRMEFVVVKNEKIKRECDEDNGGTYFVDCPIVAVINGERYKVGDPLENTGLFIAYMSENVGLHPVKEKYVVTLVLASHDPLYNRISFHLGTDKAKRKKSPSSTASGELD